MTFLALILPILAGLVSFIVLIFLGIKSFRRYLARKYLIKNLTSIFLKNQYKPPFLESTELSNDYLYVRYHTLLRLLDKKYNTGYFDTREIIESIGAISYSFKHDSYYIKSVIKLK